MDIDGAVSEGNKLVRCGGTLVLAPQGVQLEAIGKARNVRMLRRDLSGTGAVA